MDWFLKSTGLKRRIASLLSMLMGIVMLVPEAQGLATAIQWLATFFGVAGLIHAVPAKSLSKELIGTITSLLATIVGASYFFPFLLPAVPILKQIIIILGSSNVGKGIGIAVVNTSSAVKKEAIQK